MQSAWWDNALWSHVPAGIERQKQSLSQAKNGSGQAEFVENVKLWQSNIDSQHFFFKQRHNILCTGTHELGAWGVIHEYYMCISIWEFGRWQEGKSVMSCSKMWFVVSFFLWGGPTKSSLSKRNPEPMESGCISLDGHVHPSIYSFIHYSPHFKALSCDRHHTWKWQYWLLRILLWIQPVFQFLLFKT